MKFAPLLSITALTSSIFIAIPQAKAVDFLDLNSFTVGGPGVGQFAGTLGGVNVTGSLLAGGSSNFTIAGINPSSYEGTTIDNTTPQYSYSNIYTPFQSLGDRVGYTMSNGPSSQSATLKIQFSSPVTNPIFHVANLDGMIYDFSDVSNNPIALNLLSGNGGGGDGLTVDTTNKIIADANPIGAAFPPYAPPPTTGTRSAYGSVELLGTFSTLNIKLRGNPNLTTVGDGGSFILSSNPQTVPEPTSTFGFLALGTLGAASTLKRKLKPSKSTESMFESNTPSLE